jgi:hypothetical protein
MRVSGALFDLNAQLRPSQMHHLLFHLLHVFYGGAGRAWRDWVIRKHTDSCVALSLEDREAYVQADRVLAGAAGAGEGEGEGGPRGLWGRLRSMRAEGMRRKAAHETIDRLERVMSYREIVHARCEARGWEHLPGPSIGDPVDTDLMPEDAGQGQGQGQGQGEPGAERLEALAAYVAKARAQWWHDDAVLREFVLEDFRVENIEVSAAPSPPLPTERLPDFRGVRP